MEKGNKKQSVKAHVKFLHQQLIIFQKPSEHDYVHNPENANQQIQNKITHKLKNSILSNKLINSNHNHLINYSKSSNNSVQTLEIKPHQIFGVPLSKINHPKLNPLKKSYVETLSYRKLFPEEEIFLKELREKTKIKSFTNSTNKFTNEDSNKNISNLQHHNSNKIDEQKNIFANGQKRNRSRTLDLQNPNEKYKQVHNRKERQRNYSFLKKCLEKQQSQNANKFYEKFESFCEQTQRQRMTSLSEQKSIYKDSFKDQKKPSLQKKQFFRQRMCNGKTIMKQLRFDQDLKEKEQEKESQQTMQTDNYSQREVKAEIIVKINSNNQNFIDSYYKRSTVNKTEISPEKSSINTSQKLNNEFNEIYRGTPDQKEKNLFFSWKGERIHQTSKQKQKTAYLLLKSDRKANKKKAMLFTHQKALKLSNDMHIVLTQNRKTKINTFHNSILLKEQKQKVDVLRNIFKQSFDSGKPQRISIPYELEINKLSIADKRNLDFNQKFEEIVKNVKTVKRSPRENFKTEKKYHLRMEDAKPWEIILESKQLFNSSFYDNRKQ